MGNHESCLGRPREEFQVLPVHRRDEVGVAGPWQVTSTSQFPTPMVWIMPSFALEVRVATSSGHRNQTCKS